MNCLIIYYSLTNSTALIASNIADGIRASGSNAVLCNIKDDTPPGLDEFDMLGIGCPVYGFNVPINVLELIERLTNKKNIPSFAFLTNGSYAWNTGELLKKALNKAGFEPKGWFYNRGADYFIGYLKRGCFTSPNHPTQEEKEAAKRFGYDMMTNDNSWPELTQSPPIVYRIEQILLNRHLVRLFYQKHFKLKTDLCISCGICERGCPTRNIHLNPEGFPVWGRNCIMCLSCEMHCPKGAIASPISWPVMNPIMNYNVSHIMKDPDIDKLKVTLHNGKIESYR